MSEVRKEKLKITSIVAIIAFAFSALGTVAGNAYVAGQYAEKINTAVTMVRTLQTDVKQLDQTYVRKDTFQEYTKGRDDQFQVIKDDLKFLRDYITKNSR